MNLTVKCSLDKALHLVTRESCTYSSVFKNKNVDKSISYLIINSFDQKLSNTTVDNYFKNNFTPGSLGADINKAKVSKDGFLIDSTDETSDKKLKETLQTKLSKDISESTSPLPKIII